MLKEKKEVETYRQTLRIKATLTDDLRHSPGEQDSQEEDRQQDTHVSLRTTSGSVSEDGDGQCLQEPGRPSDPLILPNPLGYMAQSGCFPSLVAVFQTDRLGLLSSPRTLMVSLRRCALRMRSERAPQFIKNTPWWQSASPKSPYTCRKGLLTKLFLFFVLF